MLNDQMEFHTGDEEYDQRLRNAVMVGPKPPFFSQSDHNMSPCLDWLHFVFISILRHHVLSNSFTLSIRSRSCKCQVCNRSRTLFFLIVHLAPASIRDRLHTSVADTMCVSFISEHQGSFRTPSQAAHPNSSATTQLSVCVLFDVSLQCCNTTLDVCLVCWSGEYFEGGRAMSRHRKCECASVIRACVRARSHFVKAAQLIAQSL